MQDDAGRIDDAPQRVALVLVDLSGNWEMESGKALVQAGERVFSLGYLLLDAEKHGPRGTNHSIVRFSLNDCGETGIEQEIIERGQQAVQAAHVEIVGRVLAALHETITLSRSVLLSVVCCYRKSMAGTPCPTLWGPRTEPILAAFRPARRS